MKASYIANWLATRRHGNSKKLPHNALTFEENTNVITFLHNYAEANAILLPGRIPGYKRDDVVLLPSCTSKRVSPHTRVSTHKNTRCLSLQCLGGVCSLLQGGWTPFCQIIHFYRTLEAAGTSDQGHEANVRPLLGVSTKQQGHHESSQHARGAEV